jgi:hypothetical protein
MRWTWWAATLAAALGCSSGTTPARPVPGPSAGPAPGPGPATSTTPAPIPPPTAGNLTVRYPVSGGSITRFRLTRRDSVVSTMPTGDEQTQLRSRSAWVTVAVVSTDSAARLSAVVDSVTMDEGVLPQAQLDSAVGTRWTAIRRPGGAFTDFACPRRSLVGDQVRDELRLLFPPIPAAGARPGQSWRDSVTVPALLTAFELPEVAVGTFAASAAAVPGGSAAVALGVVRQRTASGETRQFDQSINLTSTGRDSLSWALSPTGQVLDAGGIRRTDLILEFPTIGQRVTVAEIIQLQFTPIR